MHRCTKKNSDGLMAGALLGGLIGAALALLYAPQSGDETRKILKNKVDEAKKDLNKAKLEAKGKILEKQIQSSNTPIRFYNNVEKQ